MTRPSASRGVAPRSPDTAGRIRAAALRLFARHGYAAVPMRRIAAEVGLQVGALYNHTPDKQSLLADLMLDHMTDLLAALEAAALPDDPGRALDSFVRFHLRFHAERPDAVFVAYMELRNLTAANFDRIEGLRRAYEARLADILRRGVASGRFEMTDVEVGTRAVIAMLTGLTTWFRPEGRLSLAEIETIYVGMVRRAVSAT